MARVVDISANLNAFLDAIGWSEGTTTIAQSDDGYNVLCGSLPGRPVLFPALPNGSPNYSDHPRIFNADLDSTAAGRYQIIKGMFDIYKVRLNLSDFSPQSQDMIAIQMLKERGASHAIENGDLSDALAEACKIWASLPGATFGQHVNSIVDFTLAFQNAGGVC